MDIIERYATYDEDWFWTMLEEFVLSEDEDCFFFGFDYDELVDVDEIQNLLEEGRPVPKAMLT